MKQESMNLESQASLDYAERIARITPERLDAIRTAQAERSERFHAARRVLEKLSAWHPDCAVYAPGTAGGGSAVREGTRGREGEEERIGRTPGW